VADYERVWTVLCPHFPLEDLHSKLNNAGLDAVVEIIKTTSGLFRQPHVRHEHVLLTEPVLTKTLLGFCY